MPGQPLEPRTTLAVDDELVKGGGRDWEPTLPMDRSSSASIRNFALDAKVSGDVCFIVDRQPHIWVFPLPVPICQEVSGTDPWLT